LRRLQREAPRRTLQPRTFLQTARSRGRSSKSGADIAIRYIRIHPWTAERQPRAVAGLTIRARFAVYLCSSARALINNIYIGPNIGAGSIGNCQTPVASVKASGLEHRI
jgi:hypothetical protein